MREQRIELGRIAIEEILAASVNAESAKCLGQNELRRLEGEIDSLRVVVQQKLITEM